MLLGVCDGEGVRLRVCVCVCVPYSCAFMNVISSVCISVSILVCV